MKFDPSRWKDADKVLMASGLTLPFALAWVWRTYQIQADPSISPYVNRDFLQVHIPFLWVQALGHAVLSGVALLLRRRPQRQAPWLIHVEIQFWILCLSWSLWSVGAFTTPFFALLLGLPILGYLVFPAGAMHRGLVTMAVCSGAAMVLPQLGVVPYAPFLATAPFADGRLQGAWVVAFGAPSVFVAVLVLWVHSSLVSQLRDRQAKLEVLSSTDQLTGLMNRAVFFRRLEEEVARARRHGHALCVVMVDADHFKEVNDSQGHLVGDAVLRRMGELLGQSLRLGDVAARYGGEEFALLLPHTALSDSWVVAERLLKLARTLDLGPASTRPHLTVSLGVAELVAEEAADALVARADAALYEAKRAGRDRAVLAAPP